MEKNHNYTVQGHQLITREIESMAKRTQQQVGLAVVVLVVVVVVVVLVLVVCSCLH